MDALQERVLRYLVAYRGTEMLRAEQIREACAPNHTEQDARNALDALVRTGRVVRVCAPPGVPFYAVIEKGKARTRA